MLPYQSLTSRFSRRLLLTRTINNPIDSPPTLTPPPRNSKSTTPRSSQRSPSATKTYNTTPGSSSKIPKSTIATLTNLQIRPFIHILAYNCLDDSSIVPNQTFSNSIPEIFGEKPANFLENSMTHLRINVLENSILHRQASLPFSPLPLQSQPTLIHLVSNHDSPTTLSRKFPEILGASSEFFTNRFLNILYCMVQYIIIIY